MTKKPGPDDAEQSKRFKEAAHELGLDESTDAFTRALNHVVPVAQAPKQASKKPAKKTAD